MLGILDWGIGGLGFYARLKEARPASDFLYLSDSGAIPYGKLGREELRDRVAQAIGFLVEQGAAQVVVACNAASTVVPALRGRFDCQIVSIIEQGIAMVRGLEVRCLGVVGGARTVRSGIYQRELGSASTDVRGRIAQPLSALIEAGEWRGETFALELERILQPLKRCDALLLACTHYPAAIERFRELLPGTQLLDPVDHLLPYVLHSFPLSESDRTDRFYTTGDVEEMRRAGSLAFGIGTMVNVERVAIR